MAIMDVQIVTSSLTQIQGGLAASTDEISWVQTSYLIADVVMVPLSGTLSRLLSTRVLFVIAALGFTGASALCATATSLGQMIVYRALQGFSGGAMMPLVFPVVYTKFRDAAAGADHGADRADPEPLLDVGSDDRRLLDRYLFLALAVPRQYRARHRRRRRRMGLDRHRQARAVAVAPFRFLRARADGAVSRLPPIRASRKARAGIGFRTARSSPP